MTLQLYVWHTHGVASDIARQRMATTLGARAAQYEAAYGRAFEVEIAQTDVAIVGTLGYDRRVADGAGWIGDAREGAVVVGALEAEPDAAPGSAAAGSGHLDRLRAALLGKAGNEDVEDLPGAAIALPGRWAAAAWRHGEAVVVNGASSGLSLWKSEGTDGWAVGSGGRLLLDLVGRTPEIDLDAAALNIAMAGWTSPLAGVDRFDPGQRATIGRDRRVRVDRPLGFDRLVGPRQGLAYADVVNRFAERVVALVDGELAGSANPHVALSGGRDSRLVAAAAVRAGRHPTASTGGPVTSPDVQLGRRVAEVLELQHRTTVDRIPDESDDRHDTRRERGGSPRAQLMTFDRLASWIRLGDGTAPAPLAWVAKDLSRPRPPQGGPVRQTFNGLGGEAHRGVIAVTSADIDRPGSAARGRDVVLDVFSTRAKLRRPVRDLLATELDRLDGLENRSIPLSEWLMRFHWRVRENGRVSDTLGRADLESWTWAPLMNLALVSLSREAPARARASSRLIEDATLRLAPELAGLPYDRRVMPPPKEWMTRWVARLDLTNPARRIRSYIQGERRPAPSTARNAALRALWEEVYLGPGDHVWPELVTRAELRRWIQDEPDGSRLKYLSVPELLLKPEG